MSFPGAVKNGERIDIMAPVGYFFHEIGESKCMGYKHVSGFLTRTIPTCGANMISWKLLDDLVPEGNVVTFDVHTRNPDRTPEGNYFKIRVRDMATELLVATLVIPGYEVIPSLLDLSILNIPPQPNTPDDNLLEHSCRGHLDTKLNNIILRNEPCSAIGSLTTLQINFSPRTAANLVRITGWVYAPPKRSIVSV
jgi:hypothetical protein